MKLSKLQLLAGFTAALVIAGFVGLKAVAQQAPGNGFRISPVRIDELVIERGGSQTLELTVENLSETPTTARVIINDFVASDKENGEPKLILDEDAEPPKNSFRSLVEPLDDIELGPRESKQITATVAVPETASAGGYYGAIRFAPVIADDSTGNVGLTASVGTIVLIRVPGDLTERLDLLELSAAQNGEPKSFLMSGDFTVMARLRNEGDIHVKPFGKVIVKDMFGKTVHEYEFNAGDERPDSRANVLPGSTRKFEEEMPKRNYFGRYTIEANLGYIQGSDKLIISRATFWYVPPWAMGLVGLVVVGSIGGGYMAYNRRAQSRRYGKNRR